MCPPKISRFQQLLDAKSPKYLIRKTILTFFRYPRTAEQWASETWAVEFQLKNKALKICLKAQVEKAKKETQLKKVKDVHPPVIKVAKVLRKTGKVLLMHNSWPSCSSSLKLLSLSLLWKSIRAKMHKFMWRVWRVKTKFKTHQMIKLRFKMRQQN